MQILFLIGRIILGLYWLQAAYNHFKNTNAMAGYAKMKNVGAAKTAVIGTGILALVGGLSILLGLWPTIGIWALVIFLLGVTFKMHAYWSVQDPQQKMGERVNFMKNIALLAALLMMLAIAQPWVYSIHL